MPRPILSLLGAPPFHGLQGYWSPEGCLWLGSHAPQLNRCKADLIHPPARLLCCSLGKGHRHLPLAPQEPGSRSGLFLPSIPPYPVNREVLPVVFPQPRTASAAPCRLAPPLAMTSSLLSLPLCTAVPDRTVENSHLIILKTSQSVLVEDPYQFLKHKPPSRKFWIFVPEEPGLSDISCHTAPAGARAPRTLRAL